jgi:hypothetical protein
MARRPAPDTPRSYSDVQRADGYNSPPDYALKSATVTNPDRQGVAVSPGVATATANPFADDCTEGAQLTRPGDPADAFAC